MATSGGANSGGTPATAHFYLRWQLASQNARANTSTINWQAGLWTSTAKFYSNGVKIKSGNVHNDGIPAGTWSNITTPGDHHLRTGSFTVSHDGNGNFSFGFGMVGWLYGYGDRGLSGSDSLPSLARASEVTTNDATGLTTTSAGVSGNVTWGGNQAVTSRGIVWGTSSNPTTSSNRINVGSGTGAFSTSITGLSPDTTYYFRAFSINGSGTSYGANKSFRTYKNPSVSTQPVTDTGSDTAKAHGTLINAGYPTITEKGFVYGTSSNPTTSDSILKVAGTALGAYQGTLTNLDVSKLYYVRAYAKNAANTVYGTQVSFMPAHPAKAIGAMKFSGYADRTHIAQRRAIGSFTFNGNSRGVVLVEAEALQGKRYLYKVYDEDGEYIETWSDIKSEISWTNEINTIGSTMNIELARNSDSKGVTTSKLLAENSEPLLTESGQDILATEESANQVGPGSSVQYNNRVDIMAYYGSVEPLLTEDEAIITTEDGDDILVDIGSPNGRRVFTGFISEINSRYGGTETTMVQLTSYGFDLGQYPITTEYNTDVTTVPFFTVDPSTIYLDGINRFEQTSNLESVTYTHITPESVELSGTKVSYTFKSNTYKDLVDKTLELLPANWYYRIGLGDNIVYVKERKKEAEHLFYLGKHIKELDVRGSILDVVNRVFFTGGGNPALYTERNEAPAPRTRRVLKQMSDNRVTVPESAGIIADGAIDEKNKIQYRTTVEILSEVYDIEQINVGEMVGFRNFGNYVDDLVFQIVGITYTGESVQLALETKPPTINKRLADIQRNLTVAENANVPDEPNQ